MTKAELITKTNEKLGGFSRKDCMDAVEGMFEIMKQTMEKGQKIKISGFGNFVVRKKKARMGRNPHTSEAIEITARKVLTFKASQILKDAVNSGQKTE